MIKKINLQGFGKRLTPVSPMPKKMEKHLKTMGCKVISIEL